MPGPEVVAVVALLRVPGRRAEVAEVAGRVGRLVIPFTGRRLGERFVLSPARTVALLVLGAYRCRRRRRRLRTRCPGYCRARRPSPPRRSRRTWRCSPRRPASPGRATWRGWAVAVSRARPTPWDPDCRGRW